MECGNVLGDQVIIVDLKPIIVRCSWKAAHDGYFNGRKVRETVLDSLCSIERQCSRFGEMVIACDGTDSWREKRYPFYKWKRRQKKDPARDLIYNFVQMYVRELMQYAPWPVMVAYEAEADDIIATLALQQKEPTVVVSEDRDFVQLHTYGIKQWAPKVGFITGDEEDTLEFKIFHGDSSDSVPNCISADDVYVKGDRQTRVPKGVKQFSPFDLTSIAREYPECVQGVIRNTNLVDLRKTPQYIKNLIVERYARAARNNRLPEYIERFRLEAPYGLGGSRGFKVQGTLQASAA